MPTASKVKTESALKFLAIAAVALLAVYAYLEITITPTPHITLAGQTLMVDIADSPQLRQRGLSGRSELADNRAMLFIFETSSQHSFWMKDMLIPIDIIWLDALKNVIHIEANVSPDSYPETFQPNAPARYVVETNAGWAETYDLMLGDNASFFLR